jgi:hypothetical protein
MSNCRPLVKHFWKKKAQSGQIYQASGEANKDNVIYFNESRVLTSLPATVSSVSHATLPFKTSTISRYKSYNTDKKLFLAVTACLMKLVNCI